MKYRYKVDDSHAFELHVATKSACKNHMTVAWHLNKRKCRNLPPMSLFLPDASIFLCKRVIHVVATGVQRSLMPPHVAVGISRNPMGGIRSWSWQRHG